MTPTAACDVAGPAGIVVRPISADELGAFMQAMSVPYGFDPSPERLERISKVFELSRLRAAFDGEQIVATFGSLSLDLTVPGGSARTAGTSVVSVLPTHRRRGILRKMITEHLAEAHQNGELLAALWASESSIYGRFGYGPASDRAVVKLEKRFARFNHAFSPRGSLRLVDCNEAQRIFPEIYQQVLRRRPGMFERGESWWRDRFLADPDFNRRGASAHRRVLYTRDSQSLGYVIFRTKTSPSQQPNELVVVELLGIDSEAEQALWQFVFGVDLVDEIHYWNQPLDDPLQWWIEQPREMQRRIEDGVWIRPVDVAAGLSKRRYSCAGRVTFRMRDELCGWNNRTFLLEADEDGQADCRAAETTVEVELTPYALGCAYLGGHRFRELAHAGLISGVPAALRLLDAMFAWNPLPWCQEVF